MAFAVYYDTQPEKFLKKTQKDIAKRILDKIEKNLSKEAVPHDAKKIIGEAGVYRLRIGDYRALYRINYEHNRIIIFKIDKREDAYQ